MKEKFCTNCKHCDLYENENVKQSDQYYCKLNGEMINDIDEDYCEDLEPEEEIKITEPGIYDDIPIEIYHGEKDWLSSTGLRKAKKSLKDFYLYLAGYYDEEKKTCFDFGNAAEIALVEPEEFHNKVAIFDASKKPSPGQTFAATVNKEWKAEFYEANAEKYIINQDGEESFRVIEEILKSCHSDAAIKKLIAGLEYQKSIYWIDKHTGLKLKIRPDLCRTKHNVLVDVKTAKDGSPEEFSKALANNDLPFQAVMQIDGVIQSGLMDRVDNYYWLVLEKKPPFSATLYEFDPDDIAWVTREYRRTLNDVAEAKRTNKYPSYSNRADNKHGILTARLPLWYRNYE